MLLPAFVLLHADMTVEDALERLDGYSDRARVVLRRELGHRIFWYLFAAAQVRRRLAGKPTDLLLEAVLGLEGIAPAETIQAREGQEIGELTGVVLDGERLVGLAEPSPGERAAAASRSPERDLPLDYGFRGTSRGTARERTAFDVVPVFYATDRKPTGDLRARHFYASERGDLSYGIAEVSIPGTHRKGGMERPRWWRLELREDPVRHVVLMSVRSLERSEFVSHVRSTLEETAGREALVFVHGYRVSFEEAVRRAAQIAHDLSFCGLPMLYSWPSQGKLLGYLEDVEHARWTVTHFKEFLELALSQVAARVVHVLAHSMGNRPLIETLSRFDTAALPAGSAALSQVIFAAPDFDADTFRDLAREFHRRAERFTLYASSRDEALKASRELHGGVRRAGESGPEMVVIDGVDTIDASAVDTSLMGHSYYGERTILSDLFYLLRDGKGPEERFGLETRQSGARHYWVLQP